MVSRTYCVVFLFCRFSAFTFWVPCCDVRYDFRIKAMFGSSLSPFVCKRAHILFTLFVFACVKWWPTHIVLCLIVCLRLVYPMLLRSFVHFWLSLRYFLTFFCSISTMTSIPFNISCWNKLTYVNRACRDFRYMYAFPFIESLYLYVPKYLQQCVWKLHLPNNVNWLKLRSISLRSIFTILFRQFGLHSPEDI